MKRVIDIGETKENLQVMMWGNSGHTFLLGLLLGYGAAIPIGPINIEVARRNIHYGTATATSFGLGASLADLSYLILLMIGALYLLEHPVVLRVIGFIGASILTWFGIMAITMKPDSKGKASFVPQSLYGNLFQGCLLTAMNPYTVLFWGSVSAQISLIANHSPHAIVFAGLGVLLSTASWVIFLNTALHHTKHLFSEKWLHRLNIVGGSMLLLFALVGFIHSIFY